MHAFGVTTLGMVLFYKIGMEKVWRGLKESVSMELFSTVAIVMGFKKVLQSSQAIPHISAALSSFWSSRAGSSPCSFPSSQA